MIHLRRCRPTLQAVELQQGDELAFTRQDGGCLRMRLAGTGAKIVSTTLDASTLPLQEKRGARTLLSFWCDVECGGRLQRLEREIGTQASFYEPWELDGVRVWFDACQDVFKILQDTHGGPCAPLAQARFAFQDMSLSIAPEPLHPWCPLPRGRVAIEDCYNGEDCWLGAYYGASAHAGLDINHPAGTPIWAPVEFHAHGYWNSLELGHNNNRHRGLHHWPDGSTWALRCHHMTRLLVGESQRVGKGQPYASGAGVLNGDHPHSHFGFSLRDVYGECHLDPWIVFWQIKQDRLPEPER